MKISLNMFVRLMCGVLLLSLLVSCGGGGSSPTGLAAIEVTPANPSIALGTTQQLTATGIFSDNTRQDLTASVTWSAADATIADVSNAAGSNGLSTSLAVGSTLIRATSGAISGRATLTVTSATLDSIEVTPANPSIAFGTTKQLTATGIFSDNTRQDLTTSVTWTSSDAAVAAVSNTAGSNGLATSVAPGSALITATTGTVSGQTTLTVTSAALVSIEVTPTNPSIALWHDEAVYGNRDLFGQYQTRRYRLRYLEFVRYRRCLCQQHRRFKWPGHIRRCWFGSLSRQRREPSQAVPRLR